MADVETSKVEEETTTIKEVSKEVAASEPVVTSDEKEPVVEEPVKESENGTAAEEHANGNGTSANGVEDSAETTEEADGNTIEEAARKRKSEGVEVGDATDGVSAEKKAKLEEKSEAAEEAPANGEAEVTA